MTMPSAFVTQRDASVPAPWQMLRFGTTTGGLVCFGEALVPPHTPGPGKHVHTREDEAQYIVEGVMTFVVGDERFEAGPGSLVWLPREVPHVFANLGDDPVRALGIVTPAGIEPMFAEFDEYMRGIQGPPDPARVAEIFRPYGVTPLGPPLLPAGQPVSVAGLPSS